MEGTLTGTFDTGIAMGGTIIATESLGIGIVPIGGISQSSDEVIELLELPKYTYPIAGLALGYPSDNSKQKPRMPFETFKHNEKYNTEILKPAIDKYDIEMVAYLKEIGREAQEGNWSILTSNIYITVYFPKVYGSIKTQGFKKDK
ncbi:nitroreductase family protein [Clostridium tagluense]|nr:nitroreductase family protein [Clostridium tagluense]